MPNINSDDGLAFALQKHRILNLNFFKEKQGFKGYVAAVESIQVHRYSVASFTLSGHSNSLKNKQLKFECCGSKVSLFSY